MGVHEQRLADTCDRCPEPAKYKVMVDRRGGEVLLCVAHAKEHTELLDSGRYPVLPMLGV